MTAGLESIAQIPDATLLTSDDIAATWHVVPEKRPIILRATWRTVRSTTHRWSSTRSEESSSIGVALQLDSSASFSSEGEPLSAV